MDVKTFEFRKMTIDLIFAMRPNDAETREDIEDAYDRIFGRWTYEQISSFINEFWNRRETHPPAHEGEE